jgi:hypothetical protein
MVDVLAKRRFEMTRREDQHPVQTLTADGPDEPLRNRVRLRRLDRRADHLHALGSQDLIKAGAELGIPVVDEETWLLPTPLHRHRQLSRLLNRPVTALAHRHTGDLHAPA